MKLPEEINDLVAVLDDLYPAQEYTGDNITVENTVEGLSGEVEAKESTEITVCNKNLFIMNNGYSYTANGVTLTINDDEFTFKGTVETDNATSFRNIRTQHIDLIALGLLDKVLTLSTTASLPSNNIGAITNSIYNNSNNVLGSNVLNLDTGKQVVTKTLNSSDYDASDGLFLETRMYIPSNCSGIEVDISGKIQLEISDTATDIVNHAEQVYTGTKAKIKTYADTTHIYNTDGVEMSAKIRSK